MNTLGFEYEANGKESGNYYDGVLSGLYRGMYDVMGLYGDNGKENGN